MAELYSVTIPISAQDNTGPAARSAQRALNSLESSAKRTAGMKVSPVVGITDRATGAIRGIRNQLSNLQRTVTIPVTIADKATGPLRSLMGTLANPLLATVGAAGVTGLGIAAVKGFAEYADFLTRTQIGFEGRFGAERSTDLMGQIRKFAIDTPFEEREVVELANLATAYGLGGKSGEWLLGGSSGGLLQIVGDAVAGVAGGAPELQGTMLALGQMSMRQRLSAQEMNQLMNQRQDAWGLLAQGLMAEEYSRDRDSAIKKAIEMVESEEINGRTGALAIQRAMRDRFGARDDFRGAMAELANRTIGGLWSQIWDAVYSPIASGIGSGIQRGVIPHLERITGWIGENKPKIDDFAASWGGAFERGINRGVRELEGLWRRWERLTGSDAWKGGDFLTRARLAWDEFVGNPLQEWLGGLSSQGIPDQVGRTLGGMLKTGVVEAFGLGDDPLLEAGRKAAGGLISGFRAALLDDGELLKAVGAFLPKLVEALRDPLPEMLGGRKGNEGLEHWLYAGFGLKQLGGTDAMGMAGSAGMSALVAKMVAGGGGAAAGAAGTAGAVGVTILGMSAGAAAAIVGAVVGTAALAVDQWTNGPENRQTAAEAAARGDFMPWAIEGAKAAFSGPVGLAAMLWQGAGQLFDPNRGLSTTRPGAPGERLDGPGFSFGVPDGYGWVDPPRGTTVLGPEQVQVTVPGIQVTVEKPTQADLLQAAELVVQAASPRIKEEVYRGLAELTFNTPAVPAGP